MDEYQRAARVIFATGLIAMGVLGLVYGDFAMQWQPVPSSIPWHSGLAYLCAAIELVLGLAFLIPGIVRIASRAALVFVALFPSDSATSFTRPKPPRSSPPGSVSSCMDLFHRRGPGRRGTRRALLRRTGSGGNARSDGPHHLHHSGVDARRAPSERGAASMDRPSHVDHDHGRGMGSGYRYLAWASPATCGARVATSTCGRVLARESGAHALAAIGRSLTALDRSRQGIESP